MNANVIANCKTVEQLNALAALMDKVGKLTDELALVVADKMAELSKPEQAHEPKPDTDELVQQAIEVGKQIAARTGLKVVRSGYYLYVEGDTKPQKEVLKNEFKCRWHKVRGCWYFAPHYPKYRGKKGYSSKEQIAVKYGEENIN
jgi:hypothetical protein